MPPVRCLAAILAADVAGYSRLMGADEEGTHERLQVHLRESVNPKINRLGAAKQVFDLEQIAVAQYRSQRRDLGVGAAVARAYT